MQIFSELQVGRFEYGIYALSRTSSDQKTKVTDTSVCSLRRRRQPYTDTLKPQYPMHFSADAALTRHEKNLISTS